MKTNLRSMIDDALDGNMAREQQHGYHSPEPTYDASVSDVGVYKLAQALNYVSSNLNDLGTTDEKLAELALLQEKLADAGTTAAGATTDAATDTFGSAWTNLKDKGLGTAWEGLSTGRKWVAGAGAGALGLGALYGGYKLLSGGDNGNRTTVIKNASLSGLDQARARAIVNLAEKYGMSQFEYFDKVAASAQFLQALGADATGALTPGTGFGSQAMPTLTKPTASGGEYQLGKLKFRTEDEANKALEAMKAKRAKDVQRLFPQQNLLSEDSRKLLTTYAEGGTLDDAARTKLLGEVKGNVNIAMSGDKAGIGTTAKAPNVKEVKLPNGTTVYVQPNVTVKGGKTLGSLSPADIQAGIDNKTIRAGVSTTAPASQFENAVAGRKQQVESLDARAKRVEGARGTVARGIEAEITARADASQTLAELKARAQELGIDTRKLRNKQQVSNAIRDAMEKRKPLLTNFGARSLRQGRGIEVRGNTIAQGLYRSGYRGLRPEAKNAIGGLQNVTADMLDGLTDKKGKALSRPELERIAADINRKVKGAANAIGQNIVAPGKGKSTRAPNEKSLPTQGRSTPGASRGTSTTTKATEKATEGFFARNRGLLYGGGAAAAAGLAGYGLYRAMRGGGGGYEPSREPAQPSYDSGGYGEYKSASLRKLAEDRINPARIVGGKADAFSGFDIHGQPCDPPVIENPVALRAQAVRAMINKSMNNYVSNTGDGYDLNRYLGHFNK